MGFLNLFSFGSRSSSAELSRLPSGTFTLAADGKVVSSTLPHSFPSSRIKSIARCVLASFQAARKAQVPLVELNLHYATLKITAREMKGGAVVFLMPQTADKTF